MTQLDLKFEPKLTGEQRAVWNVIRRRQGRAAAIPMPDLAEVIYGDKKATRRLQDRIRELRLKGKPIGSSSAKPNGYYRPDLEEIKQTVAEMKKRGISTLVAAQALEKHYLEMAGQQRLNHGNTE